MLTIIMISLCASMAHPVSAVAVQPAEAPPNLTLYPATNITNNSTVLTWTPYNDPNFDRYEVRRTSSSGDYGCSCSIIATIYSWNEISVVAGDMAGNSTYYFIVRTYNTMGLHSDSNEISVTTLPDPWDMTPPTIYDETPGWADEGSQITFLAQITDNTGVTNSAVFYRIVGESTFTRLDMLKCPECGDAYNATFTAPMGDDTLIEYYIYASDGNNSATSPSNAPAVLHNIIINAHPPPVQIISPINATKNSALLTWTPSTIVDFRKYSIYISQNSSQGVVIANISYRQTSSYLMSGLLANTTYYFSIRVYDDGWLFQDSSQVTVTTLADDQTQPNPGIDILSWLSQYGLYAAIGAIAVVVVAIAAGALIHGKK